MELITWAWIVIIIAVVGFIIYYLLQPAEKKQGKPKEEKPEAKEAEEGPKEGGGTLPPTEGGTPSV